MNNKSVLLLIGSPKLNNSTSKSIGEYLLNKFKSNDYYVQILSIYDALKSKESTDELIESFNESDIILFSYPLYVDSLPANCIHAFEIITEARTNFNVDKEQKFLAIGNCGFYEREQINNSINVLEFFANENNLLWLGGVTIGAGGQIDGKSLESLGGMTITLRKALDEIAISITNGLKPPKELIEKRFFPPEPKFMYFLMANWSFKRFLKKKSK